VVDRWVSENKLDIFVSIMLDPPPMKSTTKRIALDWSKLFGFCQVKSAQGEHNTKQAKALIESRLGGKVGRPIKIITR